MYPESIEDTFLDLATLTELSERIRKELEDIILKYEKQGLLNWISDHNLLDLGNSL